MEVLVKEGYQLHRILAILLNHVLIDSSEDERKMLQGYLEKLITHFDEKGERKIMLKSINAFMVEYSNVAADAPSMATDVADLLEAWKAKGHLTLEEVVIAYDEEFPEMSEPLVDFVLTLMKRLKSREDFWRNSKTGDVMRELCEKCEDIKEYLTGQVKELEWPPLLT